MATDDELNFDTDELRKVAGFYDGYSTNLLTSIGKLKGLTITPGTFPAGIRLKATVDDRVASLVSNVTALGNAHATIAENLRKIAKDYDKTEDGNVGDAERINPTIDEVNKDLVPADKNPADKDKD